MARYFVSVIGFFMVSLIVKSNLLFYSTEMKQKKSKHGFVLRQVVLKNVSGQMVSASVSKINALCLPGWAFPILFYLDPAYVRGTSWILFRLCSNQRYLERNHFQFFLVDQGLQKSVELLRHVVVHMLSLLGFWKCLPQKQEGIKLMMMSNELSKLGD